MIPETTWFYGFDTIIDRTFLGGLSDFLRENPDIDAYAIDMHPEFYEEHIKQIEGSLRAHYVKGILKDPNLPKDIVYVLDEDNTRRGMIRAEKHPNPYK